MSRLRIAYVIEAALSLPRDVDLDLDFLYTPAEYEAYDASTEPPIFSVEPVSEYFAAWWSRLDRPLFAFVGLGYELEMASSALDVLEPEGAQAFFPEGRDPRYLAAVREANKGIDVWSPVDPEEVSYPVDNPFARFRLLEARISRMIGDHRIALVPLGPKIFAVIAMIAGALHPRDVQVVRVLCRQTPRGRPSPQRRRSLRPNPFPQMRPNIRGVGTSASPEMPTAQVSTSASR